MSLIRSLRGAQGFLLFRTFQLSRLAIYVARIMLSLLPRKGNPITGMSENIAPAPKPTLGLTGLTMNAMALIAPGAFLWLTYAQQCLYGQPMAGAAMWFGIIVALLLCLATAIS